MTLESFKLCVSLCEYVHVGADTRIGQGLSSFWSRATGGYEPPDTDSRNQTQVLCKSKCLLLTSRAHLHAPDKRILILHCAIVIFLDCT